MNCREVCNKMYDYIEHHISQAEAIEFESHMKDCKKCQDEYYKREKVIIKLKNIKDIEPPSDLKHKILYSIKNEQKTQKKSSKIAYFKRYSYVAAVMILFIGGFYTIKIMENSPVKNDIYNVNSLENYTDVQKKTKEINNQQNAQNYLDKTSNEVASKKRITDNTSKVEEDNISENTKKIVEETTENDTQQTSFRKNTHDIKVEESPMVSNFRAIQDNPNKNYFYEKTILKDDNMQNFKYDIALYKNQICSIYFENNSEENVSLFVENIDSEKVSQDILVEKKSNNIMEFYIKESDCEQDVYTINIEALDGQKIDGYLKIEIFEKND
ncbi:zf-HC2 domain-containing protein [uncultured Tyzzerella sp.]|uniref:anti-sigma factor family protein n=1 Tax=uncultured Tyzzerella sp. TaxID=2321398 RepID=UPI0029437EDB|nr:zf-HC2 domain-containing protein [uncultured Tyzzerella sp.]